MRYNRVILVNIVAVLVLFITVSCSNTVKISPVKGQIPFDQATDSVPQSIGLCLSGGGYRAALYHLGVLTRLNELGMLKQLGSISAVSGGSITAAYLGLRWDKLVFSETEVANNFDEIITRPIIEFTRNTIDTPSIWIGALTPLSSASELVRRLNNGLFKKGYLTDLSAQGPKITIRSTSLATGGLWFFSRDHMGGNDFGVLPNGDTPIAVAVAASAGYPPFLAPTIIDISKLPSVERGWRKRRSPSSRSVEVETFLEKRRGDIKSLASNMSLADGGILNNVGSESCLNIDIKNAAIVSSAAVIDRNVAEVNSNWLSTGRKSIDLIYSAKERYILESAFKDERNENRSLIAVQLHSPRVKGIISTHRRVLDAINIISQGSSEDTEWAKSISNLWSQQRDPRYTTIEDNSYELLGNASIPTRLKGLGIKTQEAIINAGYFKADISIKNSIYRRFGISRYAHEIVYAERNGNAIELNTNRIRDLIPEWIPNFWTAVPNYIELPIP